MKTANALFGILTISSALAGVVQAQSFLTNGLVAYYPFNGNANDASGNGNNGFAENTFTTTNQSGQPNSALGFTGNSWVYVPYSPSLFTTNYSVSLMFNCETSFGSFCMLRSGNASTDPNRGYAICSREFEQHFGFSDFDGIFNPGNVYHETDSAECVTPIGNWQQHHWYNLSFTRSGNNAQLYLNGVLIASKTDTPPYAPAQSSPLYIGSNSADLAPSDPAATPGTPFRGIIYDVRLYNRALSSNEVTQLYATELQPQVGIVKAVKPSFSSLAVGANYQSQVSAEADAKAEVQAKADAQAKPEAQAGTDKVNRLKILPGQVTRTVAGVFATVWIYFFVRRIIRQRQPIAQINLTPIFKQYYKPLFASGLLLCVGLFCTNTFIHKAQQAEQNRLDAKALYNSTDTVACSRIISPVAEHLGGDVAQLKAGAYAEARLYAEQECLNQLSERYDSWDVVKMTDAGTTKRVGVRDLQADMDNATRTALATGASKRQHEDMLLDAIMMSANASDQNLVACEITVTHMTKKNPATTEASQSYISLQKEIYARARAAYSK